MGVMTSLRIPGAIYREIERISSNQNITLTETILRLVRAGLEVKKGQMLHQNRTLPEISEDAIKDGNLVGAMTKKMGLDCDPNPLEHLSVTELEELHLQQLDQLLAEILLD